MKHMKNIKLAPALGFLMESNFLSGRQTQGFFGLKEKVTFSVYHLNSNIK